MHYVIDNEITYICIKDNNKNYAICIDNSTHKAISYNNESYDVIALGLKLNYKDSQSSNPNKDLLKAFHLIYSYKKYNTADWMGLDKFKNYNAKKEFFILCYILYYDQLNFRFEFGLFLKEIDDIFKKIDRDAKLIKNGTQYCLSIHNQKYPLNPDNKVSYSIIYALYLLCSDDRDNAKVAFDGLDCFLLQKCNDDLYAILSEYNQNYLASIIPLFNDKANHYNDYARIFNQLNRALDDDFNLNNIALTEGTKPVLYKMCSYQNHKFFNALLEKLSNGNAYSIIDICEIINFSWPYSTVALYKILNLLKSKYDTDHVALNISKYAYCLIRMLHSATNELEESLIKKLFRETIFAQLGNNDLLESNGIIALIEKSALDIKVEKSNEIEVKPLNLEEYPDFKIEENQISYTKDGSDVKLTWDDQDSVQKLYELLSHTDSTHEKDMINMVLNKFGQNIYNLYDIVYITKGYCGKSFELQKKFIDKLILLNVDTLRLADKDWVEWCVIGYQILYKYDNIYYDDIKEKLSRFIKEKIISKIDSSDDAIKNVPSMFVLKSLVAEDVSERSVGKLLTAYNVGLDYCDNKSSIKQSLISNMKDGLLKNLIEEEFSINASLSDNNISSNQSVDSTESLINFNNNNFSGLGANEQSFNNKPLQDQNYRYYGIAAVVIMIILYIVKVVYCMDQSDVSLLHSGEELKKDDKISSL